MRNFLYIRDVLFSTAASTKQKTLGKRICNHCYSSFFFIFALKYFVFEMHSCSFLSLIAAVTKMSRRSDLDCKIYVGDLARDTNEKDIERAFSYYGRLRSVWVARNPAGFAFVEFEDPRDAEDAVRGLDGT